MLRTALAVLLALTSWPAAAQVRLSAPVGPTPSLELGVSLPAAPELPVAVEPVSALSPLSSVSLEPSLSLPTARLGERSAAVGRTLARPRRALDAKLWRHAEARGFSRRPRAAAFVHDEPSAPSLAAPALHGAPEKDGRFEILNAGRGEPPSDPKDPAGPVDDTPPAWRFLSAFAFVQFGLEAMAFAVPQIAKAMSGSYFSLSTVSVVGFAALTIGSLVGGPIVDKHGFRKVYTFLQAGRAVGAAVIAGLFLNDSLSLGALVTLFGLDYLLHGAGRVAEGIVPTLLYGNNDRKVNRFKILQQLLIESVGIAVPFAAGMVSEGHGFGPILIAYPIALLASAMMSAWALKGDATSGDLTGPDWGWDSVKKGWHAIRGNPTLRRASIGYALDSSIMYFLYFMVFPAAGAFLGGPGHAASVVGNLFTMFAIGGLSGTLVLLWANARRRVVEANVAPPDRHRAFLKSTSRWLVLGAVTLLGGFALPFAPVIGTVPLYVVLVPFGLTAAAVQVHLETVIINTAPEEIRGTILGTIRAAMMGFSTLGFFLLGWLFDAFAVGPERVPSAAAFLILAAALVAVAAVYVWIAKRLSTDAKLRP